MDQVLLGGLITIYLSISSACFFLAYNHQKAWSRVRGLIEKCAWLGFFGTIISYVSASIIQIRVNKILGDALGINYLNAAPEEGDLTRVIYERVSGASDEFKIILFFMMGFFVCLVFLEIACSKFADVIGSSSKINTVGDSEK